MEERREAGSSFHEPVMVAEVLETLEGAAAGVILDGTVGGGGHAAAMLERWPECRVIGVDRDPEAVEAALTRLEPFAERVHILNMRFDEAMEDAKVREEGLDGALLDLGVSSRQLEANHRGFAFRRGLPLDMRMAHGEGTPTAADLLNQLGAEELARIFHDFGEVSGSRRLAKEVVRRRAGRPLHTSDDLVAAVTRALGRRPSHREMARVFQALRIAVNRELLILEQALPRIRDLLKPAGVLAVISYHSLEDRIVKEAFRDWSQGCICPPGLPVCGCGRRPLGEVVWSGARKPSPEEVKRNPRARSARLRAWRKAA